MTLYKTVIKIQTYISILRGINVSGHKMIKMDVLQQIYEDLGFKNVQTYIQSGNVIFQDKKTKQQDLEKRIAKKIFEQYAFEVPVLVMEIEELKTIIKNNTFLKDKSKDNSYLHVTFLSAEPEKVNIVKIQEEQSQADEFVLIGKTIYLHCPNGYGNTKLSNNFFESKLKVTATTRNWKTTNELLNLGKKITNDNDK